MNKLFTKIVGAALGATMAIGVGVAVASNEVKNAEPASAASSRATSISAGDKVIIVNINENRYLSGFNASNYGTATVYSSTTPPENFIFDVEEGSASGSFSFKNGNNYISWSSGNTLISSTTKNNNSSWTVSFDGNNATVSNKNTTSRKLQYNGSSPRFACYTGTQADIRFYKISSNVLNTPSPSFADGIISWAAIPNATSYEYTIDSGTAQTTSNLSVDVSSESAGEHTFSIVAKATGYTTSNAGTCDFTIIEPSGDVSYEMLTSIASIDEDAQYVLGIDGTGFHYSGTSSWGKTALPSAQTPIAYTLKKANDGTSFTAKATISSTDYYLQIPTSNDFSMSTSSGTNTDLIIGTTQVASPNYAVANKTTTARHLRLNGTSGLRSYAGTTGSMAYFYKVVEESGDDPSIKFTDSSTVNLTMPGTTSASRTVKYANLEGAISAESLDETVCTVSLPESIEPETGTTTLTITAVAGGNAQVKVESKDDEVSATLDVVVSQNKTYTKVTKTALVTGNQECIIVVDDSTATNKYAMSKTTGSANNNRGTSAVTISNNSVTTSSDSDVAKIRIDKNGSYYSLFDKTLKGYYYGSSGSGNNHLFVSNSETLPDNDLYKWDLSFVTTGEYTYAKLECKGGNGRYIQFYQETGSNRFSTYSTAQKKVGLYILNSDIPQETSLSTISGKNTESLVIGSSINYSGTYEPANATESIITNSLPSGITVSAITMVNGTFTCSIAADASLSEGSVSVTFKPEKTVISSNLTVTLTLREYTATHDLITSTGDLIDGLHVIIANVQNAKVAGVQNANNISGADALFDTDKNTLCNSSGLGREFTIYSATLGSSASDPSGYIFYSNGKYLSASKSANNNHLSAVDTLSDTCLFDISFDEGNAIIQCVSESVTNGLIRYNSSDNIFSCYLNSTKQSAVQLYYSEADILIENDQLQADAYMNAFLFLDGTIPTSERSDTGNCRSKNYYNLAKLHYELLDDASLLSADALERLSDWAKANGERFDPESETPFTSNTTNTLIALGKQQAPIIVIIIVTSFVALTAIGGYFFIRRRKHN